MQHISLVLQSILLNRVSKSVPLRGYQRFVVVFVCGALCFSILFEAGHRKLSFEIIINMYVLKYMNMCM